MTTKREEKSCFRLVGNEKDIETSLRTKSSYFLLDHEWSQDINFNKTFTQFGEYVKQKSRQNQDELDRLPFQIDELNRTIINLPDENSIKSLISAYSKELSDLSEEKPQAMNQRILEAESSLKSIQSQRELIIENANKASLSKRSEIGMARQNINFTIGSSESKIVLLKNQIESNQLNLDRKKSQRLDLLAEYKNKDAEVLTELEVNTTCPTCSQTLPNLDFDKILADHKLHWEQEKKRKLDSILEQGKDIASQISKIQQDISSDNAKIVELKTVITNENFKLSGLPETESISADQFIDNNHLMNLTNQIEILKKEIAVYYDSRSVETQTDSNKSRKAELQALINDNNQRLGALKIQKDTVKRIDELKSRESTLLTEKNRFKTLVYLCELFEREKNETIEQQLSSHFGQIKWKLFRQQVNGGYQQVCDPMLNGKPYEAQSTGERIYTGMDIIRAFQGVYETTCPVLIDNRESLTLDVPIDSQVISLYADERYNVLTQQ